MRRAAWPETGDGGVVRAYARGLAHFFAAARSTFGVHVAGVPTSVASGWSRDCCAAARPYARGRRARCCHYLRVVDLLALAAPMRRKRHPAREVNPPPDPGASAVNLSFRCPMFAHVELLTWGVRTSRTVCASAACAAGAPPRRRRDRA
jgi:hypothetical protein